MLFCVDNTLCVLIQGKKPNINCVYRKSGIFNLPIIRQKLKPFVPTFLHKLKFKMSRLYYHLFICSFAIVVTQLMKQDKYFSRLGKLLQSNYGRVKISIFYSFPLK